MGVHTAAAALVGGAAGIVVDTQLALVKEMRLPEGWGTPSARWTAPRPPSPRATACSSDPDLVAATGEPSDVAARLGVDLTDSLLPAGQDTAFAAALAKRFHTAGGVVHALRTAVDGQVRSAAAGHALAPGSAFAEAFGLRYPIAQGPMTRVSDRPEFASAVADAGALPFLALALMAPDAAGDLLERTMAMLAGRTWGVGILGFVSPELRAGQLAAVLEARPPVALVPGGRPSLARPLEEAGIATFLHVPSPGLLELFLKGGARRFVFEGRDGQVEPRSSFVLWEQQTSQLLAGDVEGMDVLFAGGVHDARSAAMVAAMAAPLAERGARLGVLMGTAYLFTDERSPPERSRRRSRRRPSPVSARRCSKPLPVTPPLRRERVRPPLRRGARCAGGGRGEQARPLGRPRGAQSAPARTPPAHAGGREPMAATTPCARAWLPAVRSCWPRSPTTSPSWRSRWCGPAAASR